MAKTDVEDVTVDWPWCFGYLAGFGTSAFQIPPDTRFEDIHELTITRLLVAQPTPQGCEWVRWLPYACGKDGLIDHDELIRLYPSQFNLLVRANPDAAQHFKRAWGLSKVIQATGQLPPHLKNGNLRLQP